MDTNQAKFVGLCETFLDVCGEPVDSDFIELGLPLDLVLLLNVESAKLRRSGGMSAVPPALLARVLVVLEKYVQEGTELLPVVNNCILQNELDALWGCINAAITMGNIMASKNMPKPIYFGSVVKTVVLLIKFQLENTVYPLLECGLVSTDMETKENVDVPRKKASKVKSREVEKHIHDLYLHLNELLGLLTAIVDMVVLSDEVIASLCVMGLKPFFLDNVRELQVTANQLVTRLFKKYTNCRSLVMDQIFKLVGCISAAKRSQRTHKMEDTTTTIMTFTALVFDLIQSVVWLPDSINFSSINGDELVLANYKTAMNVTASFLTMFLNKSMNRAEEKTFRPLLDTFVQDLIFALHRPEWPVSEMIISQLGRSLISNFTSKHLDAGIRAMSIDVLGMLASQMREDEIKQRLKFSSILQILQPGLERNEEDSLKKKKGTKGKPKAKRDNKLESVVVEAPGTEKSQKADLNDFSIQDFHGILLNFLSHGELLDSSRCFHIIQWYRDTALFTCKPREEKEQPATRKEAKAKGRKVKSAKAALLMEMKNTEANRINEQHKQFLLRKRQSADDDTKLPHITYEDFVTISHYLVSRRHSPATRNFEIYLQQTLGVLGDSSIQIRTKALRSLRMMVDSDSTLLARPDVKISLDLKFNDTSPAVREASIDFIGKFVTLRPNIFSDYYNTLSMRILDNSLGVRRRIVRIFRDVCVCLPDCPSVPQICLSMMGRLVDEEGVRRFVVESFESLWFSPVGGRDSSQQLQRRVRNITVAVTSGGQGLFETLLSNLLNPNEPSEIKNARSVVVACGQIVDELVRNTLLHPACSESEESQPLVEASYVTLLIFAKVRPELLVKHFNTLRIYISAAAAKGPYDSEVVPIVARTLELIIPLLRETDPAVFAQLEKDCMEIVRVYHPSIVTDVIPCLHSIIQNVTHNLPLILKCFSWNYMFLYKFKLVNNNMLNMDLPIYKNYMSYLQRALFNVGIFLRHFDLASHAQPDTTREPQDGDIPTTDQVFHLVVFYLQRGCPQVQLYGVMALGNLCILHPAYLLYSQVRTMYRTMLTGDNNNNKAQVLSNIETYLMEEEKQMGITDKQWKLQNVKENLKEMCDVPAGMSSTVIQLHLADIVSTYMSPKVGVRQASWRLIQLIVNQGLVNVSPIIPMLIAMGTDLHIPATSFAARNLLNEIGVKYPAYVLNKSMDGVRTSYELHKMLRTDPNELVRGFVKLGNDLFEADNDSLYLLLRSSKQQRRAFLIRMLKCFDENEKNTLYLQLYLADNLAYFSYQSFDEPMFVIYHLSMILSISGNNTMDDYQQVLGLQNKDEEESVVDVTTIMNRIPEDLTSLKSCITSTNGYLLLLSLKQHLKTMYGITDIKMHRYSPTESNKGFEKPATRRNRPEFKPEATLQVLQSQAGKSPITELLDWFDRQKVAQQYVDFKQLMEDTDINDMESIAYADKKIADYFQLVADRSEKNEEKPAEKKSKSPEPPAKQTKSGKGKRRQPLVDIQVPEKKVAIPRAPSKPTAKPAAKPRKRSRTSSS